MTEHQDRDSGTNSIEQLRLQLSSQRRLTEQGEEALLKKHYLKRLPPLSFAIEAWSNERHIAVVTFGCPPSRELQKSACPENPSLVVELNRLWVCDSAPHGTATRVIAAALRLLPPRIVVSYADTAAGHHGGVYRAANFFYAGWTDMDRKTPRFDYVPLNGKHSRDAFRSGEFERVRRRPKVKYWTVTGGRRDKKRLQAMCAWPKLSWADIPSPGDIK